MGDWLYISFLLVSNMQEIIFESKRYLINSVISLFRVVIFILSRMLFNQLNNTVEFFSKQKDILELIDLCALHTPIQRHTIRELFVFSLEFSCF